MGAFVFRTPGGWTRRGLLRQGASLVGAGAVLGLAGRGDAAPRRGAANPVVLVVHLNFGSQPWPPTPALASLMAEALQPLLSANPGLEIRWFQGNAWQGGIQASMLAGNGPDIFADWVLPGYTAANLCLDLEPFVRRDNVDLSKYQAGQLRYIRDAGQLAPKPIALPALPEYMLPQAMIVNLGLLDQLGLKYPEPNWTYKDWEALWRASTVRATGSHPAYLGLDLGSDMWVGYDHSYNMPGAWVMAGFGGEYVDPTNLARSYLDAPGSIACGEWMFDLLYSGVAQLQWGSGFGKGTTVSWMYSGQSLPQAATSYRGLKWDFFPLPIWPKVPTTYTSTDSLGIWAGTKNPEAAWVALKYFSYEIPWQMFQMKTLLLPPALRDLTADWVEVVRQVAPPLRDKNLDLWIAQAEANQEYVGNLFRYLSNEAQPIIAKLSNDLMNRKVSVADGFTQAARQLDALEATGAQVAAAAQAAAVTFAADMAAAERSPATYRFPAPPRTGIGVAPVADPSQVVVRAGTYAVTGGGSGVSGISNGLTFACQAVTAAEGTFTCRLVAIEAVQPNTLNGGAKFGLMVRGDLSDTAAELGVEVAAAAGTPGIHVHAQATAGTNLGDYKPGSPPDPGLLPAAGLLAPIGTPTKNFLLRPVWLRLVRTVGRWQAYTSLDGVHWLVAGPSLGAEILGAWVGLYVTAHGNGNLARAVFDHVTGFVPDTFVRIGAP
jgi:hypothetical protein